VEIIWPLQKPVENPKQKCDDVWSLVEVNRTSYATDGAPNQSPLHETQCKWRVANLAKNWLISDLQETRLRFNVATTKENIKYDVPQCMSYLINSNLICLHDRNIPLPVAACSHELRWKSSRCLTETSQLFMALST